jgi:hypothetical protein
VCDSSDLLLRKVRQGTSDYAFQYDLDGLLDLNDTTVPCYSAAEVVHTSVVVSESLMKVPLPPAAQVVALESIVQSRKFWVQQRRSMNARLHEHGIAPLSGTSAVDVAGNASSGGASADPEALTSRTASSSIVGPSVVRRYGDSSESRIDLVCVKERVLEAGVQECTRDRSAAATTLVSSSATDSTKSETEAQEGEGRGASLNTTPTVVHDSSFANVPADVLKAATARAAETQWSSPGNMSLREAYMEVNRTTLSSRAPWFQDYRCVGRVQCPDCHQALGFIFRMAEPKKASAVATASSAATTATGVMEASHTDASSPTQGLKRSATTHDHDGDEEAEDGDGATGRTAAPPADHVSSERGEGRGAAGSPVDNGGGNSSATTVSTAGDDRAAGVPESHASEADGARLPHAKKTKNEKDAQVAAAATTRRGFQEALQHQQGHSSGDVAGASGNRGSGLDGSGHSSTSDGADGAQQSDEDDETTDDAPVRFVGLELKRIVQRDWNLRAFLDRYNKSRNISTFRELFPEAEELQSLYSRLLGLRTQTELYNSLLRRHKEQNDVQMALLNSNKDRMHTYDEKIKTMQQIIEAQRAQIEMQTRQIRNQEELVQSHRRQFATQQRQMDVEQLLLSQQSKTIESQKEQLRLLKTHFQVVRPEVLEELNMATSPVLPPSAETGTVSAVAATAALARATATGLTTGGFRREDSAEEDWADTNDEDDEEGDKNGNNAGGGPASSPQELSGHRSTPPAHLCGVPMSFPTSRRPQEHAPEDSSHAP